ncbi:MAG: hypothetical protein HOI34_12900 [Rhodospirillaceae bacterium]|jgi:hypothetical protein|nr:hypothetical protein [Rhodospirillaceae bacterium]MBT6204583.1 hypothetical protein [Rhodospirillaceae bacterium]MBT6509212.1 hypothetical protein [Rhodospirillaceae bacterium]MBT7646264.1 hypothetical protein [Rhodospirillaceae bacterium]
MGRVLADAEQSIWRRLRDSGVEADYIGANTTPAPFGARFVDFVVLFRLVDIPDLETARALFPEYTVFDDGTTFGQSIDYDLLLAFNAAWQEALAVFQERVARLDDPRITLFQTAFGDWTIDDPESSLSESALDKLNRADRLSVHVVADDDMRAGASNIVSLPAIEGDTGSSYQLHREDLLFGGAVEEAMISMNQGRPFVAFTFDESGKEAFCDATSESIGRRIALVLDGVVFSTPRVNSAVCGGSGIIGGELSVEQAENLAIYLDVGPMPASLGIQSCQAS